MKRRGDAEMQVEAKVIRVSKVKWDVEVLEESEVMSAAG